jgi:hypothetical protein
VKGQYLAIETVLTFGMGLALAIATITVFNNYRSYVIDTTTDKEVNLIQSEVRNTIFHLKSTDSGNMEVDLPSDIGGSDYSLSLYNGVRVSVNQNTYEKNFNGLNNRYDFEGTTDGGTVKIYKQEDNFILRPG